MELEEIGKCIVDAAVKIHRTLGPGLLESAYQRCMQYELQRAGLKVETEVSLPITYEQIKVDVGYRVDMLIEDLVIIENKTVERLLPIHTAQLLTYLKMKDIRLGYLINWNVRLIKDGLRRYVNNL